MFLMVFFPLQVYIHGLNDSKVIGICIYKLALLIIIYVVYNVLSPINPYYTFIVHTAIYVYYVTFTLLMIFVPKVIHQGNLYVNSYALPTAENTLLSSCQFKSQK